MSESFKESVHIVERSNKVVAMTFSASPGVRLVAIGHCYDCYNCYGSYMVTPAVWDTAVPNYKELRTLLKSTFPGHTQFELCLGCLETRLGRKLTLDDFIAVPANDGIRFGYAIGAASLSVPALAEVVDGSEDDLPLIRYLVEALNCLDSATNRQGNRRQASSLLRAGLVSWQKGRVK